MIVADLIAELLKHPYAARVVINSDGFTSEIHGVSAKQHEKFPAGLVVLDRGWWPDEIAP